MITPCSTPFVTPDPLVMLWTANGPMPPKDSHSHLPASPLEGRETTCRKQRPGPPGHGPRSHSLMKPRGGRLTPVQAKCMHRISPWPLQPNPLQNPSQWGFMQSSCMYVCFNIIPALTSCQLNSFYIFSQHCWRWVMAQRLQKRDIMRLAKRAADDAKVQHRRLRASKQPQAVAKPAPERWVARYEADCHGLRSG